MHGRATLCIPGCPGEDWQHEWHQLALKRVFAVGDKRKSQPSTSARSLNALELGRHETSHDRAKQS